MQLRVVSGFFREFLRVNYVQPELGVYQWISGKIER